LRVGNSVGNHHQDVSSVELERAEFKSAGIEHPQEEGIREQLLDSSRGEAEQIGAIVSCADELPSTLGVLQKEKKRDELVGKRFFAKQPVHPGQHF